MCDNRPARQHAAVEEASKLVLDELWDMAVSRLLLGEKGFQLPGHDPVEQCLLGPARPVNRIGDHKGIGGRKPRRNVCPGKISNIGTRLLKKVRSPRDYLLALVTILPTFRLEIAGL